MPNILQETFKLDLDVVGGAGMGEHWDLCVACE